MCQVYLISANLLAGVLRPLGVRTVRSPTGAHALRNAAEHPPPRVSPSLHPAESGGVETAQPLVAIPQEHP